MARYRTYTIEFKRQVAEEHLSQGTSLNQLARRHDVSRELLRIWVRKHEAGELASNGPGKADRRGYEAKIAGLERKGGQLDRKRTRLNSSHAKIGCRLLL